MRHQKQGLLVWISSSSLASGTRLILYFAAKAGMSSIALQYARELSRWGVETSISVPGAFTSGTNHFAHSGRPSLRVQAPVLPDQGSRRVAGSVYEGARGMARQIARSGEAALLVGFARRSRCCSRTSNAFSSSIAWRKGPNGAPDEFTAKWPS